jgi:hypothetical protein
MKLIFVYNAKSGLKNKLLDALHKSFSPSTYSCDLCSLTYGHVTVKKQWSAFLASAEFEKEFLYTDTFQLRFPNEVVDFPAVFEEKDGNLNVLIPAQEMKELTDLNSLIEKIKQRI